MVAVHGTAVSEVVGAGGVLLERASPELFADALEHIFRASERSSQLRQAALARAAQFDWQTGAERIATIYQSLLH